MAVENKYVNADIVAGKKANAAFVHGQEMKMAVATFEVAAADSDGSIYRLFKNIPADFIPVKIDIVCDAITAGTDWDLGLYEPFNDDGLGGVVIDKDILADGVDLSSAVLRSAPKDGLVTVDIANAQKRIYELVGHTLTTKKVGYDIALTANTVGSAAGTITVTAYFVQG